MLLLAGLSFTVLGKMEKKSNKDAERAKKYYGYAENYQKQAKKAREKGDIEQAKCLEACAAAKTKMAKAYGSGDKKLLAEGQADYKAAREKLSEAELDYRIKRYRGKVKKLETELAETKEYLKVLETKDKDKINAINKQRCKRAKARRCAIKNKK
jgi:hypothetical protein